MVNSRLQSRCSELTADEHKRMYHPIARVYSAWLCSQPALHLQNSVATANDKEASGIKAFHRRAVKSNTKPAAFPRCLNDTTATENAGNRIVTVPFALAQNLRALSPVNRGSGSSAGFTTDCNFTSNLNDGYFFHRVFGKIRCCS